MYLKHFILCLVVTTAGAFIPKLPSSLQNILTSRAILTTFGERIGEELITNSNLLQQIIVDHSRNQLNLDLFYIAILGFVLYNAGNGLDKRLSNVTWFSNVQKKTNIFILVIMIIFNRNVENCG
jgi:hypothetical protein